MAVMAVCTDKATKSTCAKLARTSAVACLAVYVVYFYIITLGAVCLSGQVVPFFILEQLR